MRYMLKKKSRENLFNFFKEENWGQVKGGKIGGRKSIENLKKLWGDKKYYDVRSKMGKIAIKKLHSIFDMKELSKKALVGRIKSRERKSKTLEIENQLFFTNKKIILDNSLIQFSKGDFKKNIILPKEMSVDLAE